MSQTERTAALDILIVDDEPDICRTIGDHMSARGHRVYTAGDGLEGLDVLKRQNVDIVITDQQMPRMDGLAVLREVKRMSQSIEVIMITAFGDVDMAVQAMRDGAFDFFTKPLKMRDLSATILRAVRFQFLRRENRRYQDRLAHLEAESQRRYGLSAFVGEGPAIVAVKDMICQVCETDATTVLIVGETGTGKELVARAIHHESARASGPFVAVDCSALSPTLVESAFYGHEKGAFTGARETRKGHFEAAHEGTLFLDEIGDMDLEMQTRLLRTLETRCIRRLGSDAEIPVDVRVISATHRDLPQALAESAFREDLFYRLNTFTIRMPPLRDCRTDVLLLADSFLHRYAREMRKPITGFTPEAVAQLEAYSFPGNVRELKNIVERAAIVCCDGQLAPEDLEFQRYSLDVQDGAAATSSTAVVDDAGDLNLALLRDLSLEPLERALIEEALRRCEGNQVHAAEQLGISRFVLRGRMARLGVGE